MPILKASGLEHQFKSHGQTVQPLRGIELEVDRGQVIVINGPSGCGKTTLLLSCGAMRRPTKGTVELEGQDIYSMSVGNRSRLRSRQIGFLFQTMELIPYLPLIENLSLVPSTTAADAEEWLVLFGLKHRARHLPEMLSQGERQRAALARALVHNPKLVIADEPTGNLDPENTAIVFDALKRFAESGGAVIIATHEADLDRMSPKVYRLDHGQLFSQS